MLTPLERSDIKRLNKRGLTHRAIAALVGHDRHTVARVLQEPVDRQSARRTRRSQVDGLTDDIQRWFTAGLPVRRMLELAWTHPEHPYGGQKSAFYDRVRKIRQGWETQHEERPIRFEGLPGEDLQVDWGEVRHLPFDHRPAVTRSFYAARLKDSRVLHVLWHDNMVQETLLRSLGATFMLLGGVPWVCVFDTLKTVPTGRDATHHPLWHPVFWQCACDFGFTPAACDPHAANQKGSVENLVKFVKTNFLPGRSFFDDADLGDQSNAGLQLVTTQVSQATGKTPLSLLSTEQAALSALPPEGADSGLVLLARADRESLVPVAGSRYSVPIHSAQSPVTVRLPAHRVRLAQDRDLLADHPRRLGTPGRVIDPTHFEPVLAQKPRARVLLYRDPLLALDEPAASSIRELCRRRSAQQSSEMLTLSTLAQTSPMAELMAALSQAASQGAYGSDYIQALLDRPEEARSSWTPVIVPETPNQVEVDRPLEAYEAHVTTVPGGR